MATKNPFSKSARTRVPPCEPVVKYKRDTMNFPAQLGKKEDDSMKEIPMAYVKANQTGIVLFILLSFIFRQPYILAALWIIQALGLVFGLKANLFVAAARPLLDVQGKETQAAELTRFNNRLGMIFLTLSLISFLFGFSILGYIFAAMFFLAAFVALCGYCIGCTMYFQYKMFKARRTRKSH
jgi:uncharacterized membrane protein YagU involved in acid resistance